MRRTTFGSLLWSTGTLKTPIFTLVPAGPRSNRIRSAGVNSFTDKPSTLSKISPSWIPAARAGDPGPTATIKPCKSLAILMPTPTRYSESVCLSPEISGSPSSRASCHHILETEPFHSNGFQVVIRLSTKSQKRQECEAGGRRDGAVTPNDGHCRGGVSLGGACGGSVRGCVCTAGPSG